MTGEKAGHPAATILPVVCQAKRKRAGENPVKQQITKNAIETAFLKLLKEKNFEKVMVKDIVEECGLTRNTFYYYYDDTYNIIEDILEREARKMIEEMQQGGSLTEAVKDIFEYLEENPKIARHLFDSAKKDDMYRYVRSTVEIVLTYYLEHCAGSGKISEANRRTIIHSCKYSVQGFIEEWLQKGMKNSLLEEVENAEQLFSIVMQKLTGNSTVETK